MIRQPGFITAEAFEYARSNAMKKKPHLNVEIARMASFAEGLCVQCLHTGSYDDEPATLARMHVFMEQSGLRRIHQVCGHIMRFISRTPGRRLRNG